MRRLILNLNLWDQVTLMASFRAIDATEIKCLLSRIPAEHCQLDQVPTWLVKRIATVLAAVFSRMCNVRLFELEFFLNHKKCRRLPATEEPSLDPVSLTV